MVHIKKLLPLLFFSGGWTNKAFLPALSESLADKPSSTRYYSNMLKPVHSQRHVPLPPEFYLVIISIRKNSNMLKPVHSKGYEPLSPEPQQVSLLARGTAQGVGFPKS
jgi:hypothetical protein